MTRIEDMSETQRQAWTTLIVDVAVFFYFLNKMMKVVSINDTPASDLMAIFIGIILVTIILHAVIASIFALRKRGDEEDIKDERDINIERKGASHGFYFLAIFVNILAGQVLLEKTLPEYLGVEIMNNTSHLFFTLVSAAFIGDIIKNAVMVFSYRNG